MKWSELRESLPDKPTAKREELIIQRFADGGYLPIRWCAISVEIGSYLGIVYVSNDALKLGEPDSFCRVNVSHRGAQIIVDMLGLALLTDKLADAVHEQAVVSLPPKLQPDSVQNGTMGWTEVMERHSRHVEYGIAGRSGLVSTVGKHWITHDKLLNKPMRAVNYGWHDKKAPYMGRGGLRMWQTVGTAHDWNHVDYSQTLVPANRVMLVNGEEMLLEDVMRHPELSKLVSYDGPMKATRHPQVDLPSRGVPVSRI